MDEWMDGWMDGWMIGWMDGWMDGCVINQNNHTIIQPTIQP
ncbi:MAG: hypothetical protein U5Q03_13425 [Bacteroidota bacterium]|nr:hypothetical protein [Bacteroidota bacterium]